MSATVSELLIDWYRNSYRDLPWRRTQDPYPIYLSEIILQQTRVDQGLPYFERILERYPTVLDLASAEEHELLGLWQGLGYYSRARNMLQTAQYIARELNGKFPDTYEGLLDLKGVGPYTASAIGSFAFGLPTPVIDGNVQRVISRLAGVEEDLNTGSGMGLIKEALNNYFDQARPALFNQAIMELGSQVCKPVSPDCTSCPLMEHCWAARNQAQDRLPFKSRRTKVRPVEFNYLVVTDGVHCLAEQRTSGIWNKLYQFPLIEGQVSVEQLLEKASDRLGWEVREPLKKTYSTTHLLSHRKIDAHFYTIHSTHPFDPPKSPIFELRFDELGTVYPVPVLIDRFLKQREEENNGE